VTEAGQTNEHENKFRLIMYHRSGALGVLLQSSKRYVLVLRSTFRIYSPGPGLI